MKPTTIFAFLKKYRYGVLAFLVMLGLFSFMSMEEHNDYWYFYDGKEMHWKIQPDVFAFRTKTHTQYSGAIDTTIVERSEFRSDNPDKINIFFFRAGVSASTIKAYKQEVMNDAEFETQFPAITMVPGAPYTENLWYFANDQMMITFRTDTLGKLNADRIAKQYKMNLFSAPAGIAGSSFTYIFHFTPDNTHPDALELSRTIAINESAVIESAEPNLVKVYSEPTTQTTTSVAAAPNEKEQFYVVNDKENTLQVYYRLHSNGGTLKVKVYDLFGRQMTNNTVPAEGNQILVDISSLSTGYYFATMEDTTGKMLFTRKFRKI